jgi:secretion/DNA translocation related TadE-like protein
VKLLIRDIRTVGGSGSVMGIALVMATVFALVAVAPLTVVLVSRTQVASAADAAALAAADTRVGIIAGFPCESAGKVAAANRVYLINCRLDGLEATVSVGRQVLGYAVTAVATAGPPD